MPVATARPGTGKQLLHAISHPPSFSKMQQPLESLAVEGVRQQQDVSPSLVAPYKACCGRLCCKGNTFLLALLWPHCCQCS